MRSLVRSAVVLIVSFGIGGGASAGKAHYKTVTVCAVLSNPKAYLRSYVAIDADVLADGRHGTILTDKTCPNEGLPLDYPQPKADHSVADFEDAISSGGTMNKSVSGRFIGRVRRDTTEKRIYYSLLSVQNLSVKVLPESR